MGAASALVVVLTVAIPASAQAAAQTGQSAEASTPVETMSGTIDLQNNGLTGQVSIGRGSMSLEAELTESGPQGEFSFGVPDQFSVSMSSANGTVQSTICGVIGLQEITASGGQGSGLQLEFHNAAQDPVDCAPASAGLTMAPFIGAVQAAPPLEPASVQQDGADLLRRLFVLGLTAGLLFLFAPGISAPLAAAAQTAPWSRLGLGLAAVIAVPVVGVLVFVFGLTIGLWWLGVLVLMSFVILLAGSVAMSGLVLGAWILERLHQQRIPAVAGFGLGLLLLTLLGLIPVIGVLVNVVAVIYGAGALLLLPRTRESERTVAVELEQPATVSLPPTPQPLSTPETTTDGEVVGPRAA